MMMMTALMTSRAGRVAVRCNLAAPAGIFAALLMLGTPSMTPAQTAPAAVTPTVSPTIATPPTQPTQSAERESSMTVRQIVARQEAHYAEAKNAQGIAVFTESQLDANGIPTSQKIQHVYFAFGEAKRVTLVMPEAAAKSYSSSEGEIPWPHVTAATLISGDTVFSIQPPKDGNSTGPQVVAVPFNPAVHENNPLASFHFRQVADEQMPLRELARAIPQMTQRPTVTEVPWNGKTYLRIDFANANTPGEHLYYLVDPEHNYLPVRIARVSNGRTLSVSNIKLAHTPQGYWMPARRERITYNAAGVPQTQQGWYYSYVTVNQGVAAKALSLMYFNLPLTTQVLMATKADAAETPASARTPASNATPTPIPRAVGTPVRVPVR